MEANSYLSGGYGIRLSLVSQVLTPSTVGGIAAVWQPSRLKGIQVSSDFGTPFLAATQVFDLRPAPRKFLSLDRTDSSEERFIENGTIVITCSGSVGRTTLINAAHQGVLISHDLLRIQPKNSAHWGWLYAFFRSKPAQEMMTSAHYGHMIKHLEPSHVMALPIPVPREELLRTFQSDAQQVLDWRNQAWQMQVQAEALYVDAIGPIIDGRDASETGFSISTRALFGKRRRLEAAYHSPIAANIIDRVKRAGLKVERLDDVAAGVWWPNRFRRVFGEEGDRYLSADELFSINPGTTKRVIVEQTNNEADYRVKEGWIVMARSGQTYGLNGSVALLTKEHEKAFFSEDLIRIVAGPSIRAGYLFTTLGHPALGRPLVMRNAYGTSIPHLDPEDVAEIPIIRLPRELEDRIADFAEEVASLRVKADALENSLAERAEDLINAFASGDTTSFDIANGRASIGRE